jgi:hypothetical protein
MDVERVLLIGINVCTEVMDTNIPLEELLDVTCSPKTVPR